MAQFVVSGINQRMYFENEKSRNQGPTKSLVLRRENAPKALLPVPSAIAYRPASVPDSASAHVTP